MSNTSSLTTRVSRKGDVAIVNLEGYLSATAGDALEGALEEVTGCERVLLVFGVDDFINSAGLAVLFDLILPVIEKGVKFRIVHPAPHFCKVFEIVGLSKDAEVFMAEEEALAGW